MVYKMRPQSPDPNQLLTSDFWARVHPEVEVIDPDGWDRKNFDYSWYEERITETEFINRVMKSTCFWRA